MYLEEAIMKVEEVKCRLERFCYKLIPCGSFRRRKEIINDLDFVVVPIQVMSFLKEVENFGDKAIVTGIKKVSIMKNNEQIDFLITDKFSFGAAVLHFTGSKEFNIMCRKIAKGRGWKLNEYGLWDGEKRIGKTEEGILEILRLDSFRDPKSRSLDERKTYQPTINQLRDQEERKRRKVI